MGADIDQKVRAYFSTFPKRTYPKGHILIFAGENPEHILYLVAGKVRKYDVSFRGDEVVVNVFKPGAFFPMSWAINQNGNDFFYKTEDEAVIHLVPADKALEFLEANPDVMLDLLSRLYRGMDGVLGRMVQLMAGNAKNRLAYELLVECRRFGETDDRGGYRVKISEVDLAARAGLTRETVSREIQKLKEKKVVKFQANKTLVVNDMAALEAELDKEL